MKDKESDLVLDDIMGEVADSAASFLLDQPPKMSDEDTDYVLDEHIMGEVVLLTVLVVQSAQEHLVQLLQVAVTFNSYYVPARTRVFTRVFL